MKNHEYAECQSLLLTQSRLIAAMPLAEFCEAIDKAEAVGPMLDPTLYQKTCRDVGRMKCIAQAARAFQSEIVRLRTKWAVEDGRIPIGKEAPDAGSGS